MCYILSTSFLVRSEKLQQATLSVLLLCLSCMWGVAEDTPASSLPTTSAPTVLTCSSAGLPRLSQEDTYANRYGGSWFDSPPPLRGTELLSSSSSNPLQVLGCVSSSEGSSSSLVPTPPSSSTLQSLPGTKFVIGTLGKTYRVKRILYHFTWWVDARRHGRPHNYFGKRSKVGSAMQKFDLQELTCQYP